MDVLIEKLKDIAKIFPLKTYEWKFPDNCPLNIPKNKSSDYARNVFLKDNFYSELSNDNSFKNHYWLIKKWGKIGSFKENKKNDLRIKRFVNELAKGELTRDSFNCISSFSKIASFREPDKYVIYDSRVIYSLNWLLLNYTNIVRLFPQPIGRSTSLSKYDMQTIFRLSKKEFEFREYQTAFHEYCSMIRKLSPEVFGRNSKPYKLEMLLFMIAPSWIVDNIEKTVSLQIKRRGK